MITTYAGNGGFGTVASPPKDGAPAISTAITPSGIASDARGNLYIADMRSGTFLRITVDGIVHLLHGLPRYLSFDSMSIPIAAGPNDSAYVGLGSWIFRFGADGDFEVFEPALKLSPPETSLGAVVYNALAFDASGTLYASLNFPTGLFSLSADGVVATYLGYGRIGMSTADGPAINSESVAKGLTLDLAGNIYLSDSLASRIRVIPAGCQPPILP